MKVGIISDTHNKIDLTKKAIDIFRENNVEVIIHAGDFTSPRMLALFKGFECRFVRGNGDIDIEDINRIAEELDFGEIKEVSEFEIDNKKFILFHGNDVPLFRKAVASQKYDYIIKGHTHMYENYVKNNVRIVNPGSLYNSDSSDEFSVVILDTKKDQVEFIRIEED